MSSTKKSKGRPKKKSEEMNDGFVGGVEIVGCWIKNDKPQHINCGALECGCCKFLGWELGTDTEGDNGVRIEGMNYKPYIIHEGRRYFPNCSMFDSRLIWDLNYGNGLLGSFGPFIANEKQFIMKYTIYRCGGCMGGMVDEKGNKIERIGKINKQNKIDMDKVFNEKMVSEDCDEEFIDGEEALNYLRNVANERGK